MSQKTGQRNCIALRCFQRPSICAVLTLVCDDNGRDLESLYDTACCAQLQAKQKKHQKKGTRRRSSETPENCHPKANPNSRQKLTKSGRRYKNTKNSGKIMGAPFGPLAGAPFEHRNGQKCGRQPDPPGIYIYIYVYRKKERTKGRRARKNRTEMTESNKIRRGGCIRAKGVDLSFSPCFTC